MADAVNAPLEIRIESSSFPSERTRVRKLSGTEAISRLFHFDVEVVMLDREGPEARSVAGTEATLVFEQDGQELRRIHGMIAEAVDLLQALDDYRTYRLRLVPQAYKMTLIENQETFMNVTAPGLIEQKIGLVGIPAELRIQGSYPTREFVVQFQESDFAFVSRLAEHNGISYYFDQSGGTDTMVFTDRSSGFQPAPGAASIHYRGRGEERDIFQFESGNAVVPGMFVVRDYNYRTPMVDLTAEHPLQSGFAGGVIAWGDHYKTPAEGQQIAQIRAEEREAGATVYSGKSTVVALTAGGRSTLEGHPYLGSVEMLITEVHHQATQAVWGSAEHGRYLNTFRGIPASINYRPARITPKPKMAGMVTGIIDAGEGGSADYAQIDAQGRYMVRFLFDSAASGGRLASRPVRMLQNHAGENYGTHFPLKPGIEVLIGFVNGDPDRPLIVGAAPNPLTPSPVDARNRTTHRIKTMAGIRIDLVDE